VKVITRRSPGGDLQRQSNVLSLKKANTMFTRMAILAAAAGLSLAGAANAAPADPQPSYSDGYGYDIDHVYNDGYGYTDANGDTDGNGSSPGFSCYDNGGYDPYGNADCGWYNGFFYPGFGSFVFDRDHHRHEMTGRQHDHFARQGRVPGIGPIVGLGSGGVRRSMSQPQGVARTGGGGRAGFGGGGSGGGGHR
jgi:hypothetical protein